MNENSVPLIVKVRAAAGRELSEIGEKALKAFFSLPGSEDWHPDEQSPIQMLMPFDIGLPLALLGDEKSVDHLKKRIGYAIAKGKQPDKSDWSEVQAGALMCHFGAEAEFVRPQKTRTPDIRARWPSNSIVDVEVTAAETRQVHKDVQDALATLCEVVRARDQKWHIVAFFSDASDQSDINAAVEEMIQLSPGNFAEQPNRWIVRGVEPERRDDVVGGGVKELFAPTWWPQKEPTFGAISTVVGGEFSPVVKFESLIPQISYMNPISRKADRPQRDTANPYLIVVDVKDLAGAHQRIGSDLVNWFPTWEHVSAVMLYDARFFVGVRTKEWHVSIYRNPHATLRLPNELSGGPDGEELRVAFELSVPG